MLIFSKLYKKTTLQFTPRQFAQFAAFAFYKVDVGEEVFAVEFFAEVGEAVGPFVEVWLVYLVYVTGEDDLGSFAGTGDDGFYFVRGEVLGFVYDEEGVG